jgi:hypothetical protein
LRPVFGALSQEALDFRRYRGVFGEQFLQLPVLLLGHPAALGALGHIGFMQGADAGELGVAEGKFLLEPSQLRLRLVHHAPAVRGASVIEAGETRGAQEQA